MKYFQWLRNLRRTSFSAQILVLLVLVNTTAAADQPAAQTAGRQPGTAGMHRPAGILNASLVVFRTATR